MQHVEPDHRGGDRGDEGEAGDEGPRLLPALLRLLQALGAPLVHLAQPRGVVVAGTRRLAAALPLELADPRPQRVAVIVLRNLFLLAPARCRPRAGRPRGLGLRFRLRVGLRAPLEIVEHPADRVHLLLAAAAGRRLRLRGALPRALLRALPGGHGRGRFGLGGRLVGGGRRIGAPLVRAARAGHLAPLGPDGVVGHLVARAAGRANDLDHPLPPNPWSHVLASSINPSAQDSKRGRRRPCCRSAPVAARAQSSPCPMRRAPRAPAPAQPPPPRRLTARRSRRQTR